MKCRCFKLFVNLALFRVIEMATRFPYFNEESETNWKEDNLNKEMEINMKEATGTGFGIPVEKMAPFKVHDMFEKKDDGSLEFVGKLNCLMPTCKTHYDDKER